MASTDTSGRSRESAIETHLVRRCHDLGLLCLKTIAAGRVGIPDRLVLGHDSTGAAVSLFIELKRPGGLPRPIQRRRIEQLRQHGAHAVVADTTQQVDDLLTDYFTNPSVPIADRDPHQAPLPGRAAVQVTDLAARGPGTGDDPRGHTP